MKTSRVPAILGLTLMLLAGCAPPIGKKPLTLPDQPATFRSEIYASAAQRGQPVYRLDASRSRVVVRVYRGGRLARFGHDHVVASHQVQGLILWTRDFRARRADLYAPLASLIVDEANLRQLYGLSTQPSAGDIAGTRNNMLYKTLRVNSHPFVTLHLEALGGSSPVMPVRADITLNGITRTQQVDVVVKETPGSLYFAGAFKVRQTEFGLEPYSLLGGLLRVEDEVDIDFALVADAL